jgi:hypothetical protein
MTDHVTAERLMVDCEVYVEITFPTNPEIPFTAEFELKIVTGVASVTTTFAIEPTQFTEFFVIRVPGPKPVYVGADPVFDCKRIYAPAPLVTTFD